MNYFISVKDTAELLELSEQSLRQMIKSNKCSFAIAYKNEDSENYIYRIDKKALNRCLKGEQNLFIN